MLELLVCVCAYCVGRLYTTRMPYANEECARQQGAQQGVGDEGSSWQMQRTQNAGNDWEFISKDDLQTLQKMGKLLCTYSLPGLHGTDYYALSIQTVDAIARGGRACVIPIDLEGPLVFLPSPLHGFRVTHPYSFLLVIYGSPLLQFYTLLSSEETTSYILSIFTSLFQPFFPRKPFSVRRLNGNSDILSISIL